MLNELAAELLLALRCRPPLRCARSLSLVPFHALLLRACAGGGDDVSPVHPFHIVAVRQGVSK